MATTREPFEAECWCQVFNHARGSDNIFELETDYQIFLKLIEKYILPVANIYAYSLMPNHFHFLVQNRTVDVPESFSIRTEAEYFSHQWGNVQNTFTKKRNYRTGKRGGLFCQSINRNLINSEEYKHMCMVYIHNNPVKHGFCFSSLEWKFSSYQPIISKGKTRIDKDEVLSWFDNREIFIDYHLTNAANIFAEKYNLT